MQRTIKLLTICYLIILLIACGGNGSPTISSSSDTAAFKNACGVIGLPRIINGESCSGTSHSAVVRIMAIADGGGQLISRPICTGTLITPNVVLTAAHCFPADIEGAPVVALGAFIGEPDTGQFYNGVYFSAPPTAHYNDEVGRLFDDAALIGLEQAVPNPVMPLLFSRAAVVGEPGFVYGYGARYEGETTAGRDFSTLESGQMTIADVTQNHIFVSFNGEGVSVCNGDSGGPMVVLVNGQPALAGITSQGSTAGCAAGNVITFTNIHSPGVFNWLLGQVPTAFVRQGEIVDSTDFFE